MTMKGLKRQCPESFHFRFFHESVSPEPLSISLGLCKIFLKIRGDISSSRCTNCVVETVANGKIFNQKSVECFVWHLWEEELTYRKFFFFKFTLRLSRESGEEDLGAAGLLRGAYSAGPVSQTCYCFKGESWLRAATLDDSKTPTPVLHNTSVVVWNLYCVRVIIVRLTKRSKPM
jgi:hypothetical protein